jgi:type I restriction enzyme S subunit
MSKSKKPLVPKLRFPEFQSSGEWRVKLLEEIAPLQRGFDLPSHQIKPGNIPIVYSNGVHNYHNVGMAKGPGLVTGRSGTIGKIHFIENGDYWPHNTSLWVTSFKGNFPKFVFFMYKSIGMNRFTSGSGVPTLNRNYVHAFHTSIPTSIHEQQKIADCLSSLDELIIAEAQKLDTLKVHKKGLMQKLFPAEGETVPGLRFPEFRDAGEWEVKTLGECLDYIQPTKYLVKSTAYNDSYKTPVLTAGKTFVLGYTDESQDIFSNKLPVIIFDDFTTATKFVDFPFKAKSSAMKILLARKDTNIKFIFEAMQIIKYEVGVHKRHWISKFAMLNIATPSPLEQQKIADCLSSLDELITTQAQKIDMLKAHKKGLMQGLFPSADEVGV